MSVPTLALVAVAGAACALSGCEAWQAIQARADDDLAVLALSPAEGAAAVPEDLTPRVLFNRVIPEEVNLEVRLTRGDDRTLLSCAPDGEADALLCALDSPLATGVSYTLDVDLGPDGDIEASSRFTTALPQGLGYEVVSVVVEEVGGNGDAAGLLQGAVADAGTLLLVLRDFGNDENLPWEGDWLLGRGQILPGTSGEGEAAVRESEGYPLAAQGRLDADGEFYATAATAFFPIDVDGMSVTLLVQDLALRGQIDIGSGFASAPDIFVDALVPERSLEELKDALPGWGDLLAELITLDADSDGDGSDDAASFKISGVGARVELVQQVRD